MDSHPLPNIRWLDGGFSTSLASEEELGESPLWSAQFLKDDAGRHRITAIHRAFVSAGAQVIGTAGFQAHGDALTLDEKRRATTLARAAAPPPTLVAATIGPFAVTLGDGAEYAPRECYGDRDRACFAAYYAARLDVVLLDLASLDLIAFETIPHATEALTLIDLLKQRQQEQMPPCWLSFSVRQNDDDDDRVTLNDGTPFDSFLQQLGDLPSCVVALGVNCCELRALAPALAALNQFAAPSLALVAYPNATFDSQTRSFNAVDAQEWRATFDSLRTRFHPRHIAFGGCCGVSPEALKRIIDD